MRNTGRINVSMSCILHFCSDLPVEPWHQVRADQELREFVPLWFGCDGNLNVSALFELYIIAVFVG
jgi:hypothetical protein